MTDRRDGESRDSRENQESRETGAREPRSRQAMAYQGAIEAVFAILIAAFAGKLADDHFGTTPRYLLVGFAVGFGSFVLRLVRLGRTLQEPGPKDGDDDQ